MDFKLAYDPRPPFVPFHNRDKRFGLMVCHRRAGKTVACVNELIVRALHTKKKRAKFAYIGPFRAQAKETAWEYLKEGTKGLMKGPPRESELRIRLPNDATITIYGADNPNSLRGLYFDGVILDEFGDCRPTLWGEVLLPALLDRNGWAVFIGTPKGKNHFYHMYKRAVAENDWYNFVLKASESGLLNADQLRQARAEMTEDQWEQEMECSFEAAIPGTYYSKVIGDLENTPAIDRYEYDPDKPVYAAADLGFSDSTAWWFWQMDDIGPILIDYEEDSGQPLSFYFDMLKNKEYKYDKIYLPHDAKAANFQTGRSTIEQFLQQGFPCALVPKLKVQHGIDAARYMMPRVRFDAVNCYNGLEALRAYRRKWNEKTQQYSDSPLHDWASNGSDAFRYFALVTKDDEPLLLEEEKSSALPAAPEIRLDELWAAKESENWRDSIIRL